jgi:hypothetical protein
VSTHSISLSGCGRNRIFILFNNENFFEVFINNNGGVNKLRVELIKYIST